MPITKPLRNALFLVLAGGLALAAGLYLGLAARSGPPAADAQSRLHSLPLTDLQGQSRNLREWQSKPLILNFWATWCAPCREEMPLLDRWQREQAGKVNVLGIALDSRENVAKFREKYAISFRLLLAGSELLDTMKSLGNRAGALPFTLFLDAEGRIVDSHVGPLDEEKLRQSLDRLQRGA